MFTLIRRGGAFKISSLGEIDLFKNYSHLRRPLLYIDLRPGQTCHSKDGRSDTFRWPLMGRNRAGGLGWQYGTGLKSHGTVTNWCTGREWPVNCMTVISARWRSNMPFQRRRKCIRYWVGVNYYITGNSISWRQDVVEKASTRQKGASGLPMEFGDQTSLETRCGRESQHPAES